MEKHPYLAYCFLGLFAAALMLPLKTAAKQPANASSDHLVPNSGVLESSYVKLLKRKLYQTGADHGRIAILPSTATIGETVISLHSSDSGSAEVMLTWTKAASNLWSEAHALDVNLNKEPDVKVKRLDTRFPKTLATAIAQAIDEFLADTKNLSLTDRIVVDGVDFLVSTDNPNAKQREGVLRPDATGKRSAALRNLAQLLDNYSASGDGDRVQLERKMQRELLNLKPKR